MTISGERLHAAPRTLLARLMELSMSQSNFALRMGMSKKHVNEILNGKSSVTWTVALDTEKVLGIDGRALMDEQGHELLARARKAARMG